MNKRSDKYWFKPKSYGWGWGTPTCWQGWAVLLGYFLAMAAGGIFLLKDAPEDEFSKEVLYFFVYTFFLASILMYIGYKKGPKPEWRWGGKAVKDTKEKQ